MKKISLLSSLSSPRTRARAARLALGARGPAQQELFALARRVRNWAFPAKTAELRSVIEISNACRRRCLYCNLGALPAARRYALGAGDIAKIAARLYHERGRRVFLLQSGEDPSEEFIAEVCRAVKDIKRDLPGVTVIACLGSLPAKAYARLKEAGVDRYVLKFETSDRALYAAVKPGDRLADRLRRLRTLGRLGFGVGTGCIVGLPGQGTPSLLRDLLLTRSLSPAMASASVFIPGEDSAFSGSPPGDVDTALNFMALLRIFCPRALIPSTSSLEKLRRGAQRQGLLAGANAVTVHDGTPGRLKPVFPIYSTNRFTPEEKFLRRIVAAAGLKPARGPLL